MLNISPTLAKFTELARTRRVISVHTRLLADHLTAIGLYATLCGTREGTFLLESASEGVWSRYSFVGVHSAATLTECGGKAVWLGRELTGIGDGDPLSVLQQTLTELATPAAEGLPPFHAGMVGYLGYDVARRLEALPDTCADDLRLPELVMMLASQVAVLDHKTQEVYLIFNAINYDGTDAGVERAYQPLSVPAAASRIRCRGFQPRGARHRSGRGCHHAPHRWVAAEGTHREGGQGTCGRAVGRPERTG